MRYRSWLLINKFNAPGSGSELKRRFTKFVEITQCNGHSRSFKVTDFSTNRKLIHDFLLLINTNLPPIFHRFQVMVNFSLTRGKCLTLSLSLGVIPWQYRHKLDSLAYILAAESIGVSTRRLGLLRRSRSLKVTEFGTNRKLMCDFLLVINSNLAPILHRFRDIAFDRSKIAIFGYLSCL